MRHFTVLVASLATASAAFSKLGCYPASSVLLLLGDSYMYQSSGHCSEVCDGNAVMGLTKGNQCYCGSLVPLSDQEVSSSNCNTACDGYPQDNCGGSNYYLLYVDSSESYSTIDSSSSSATLLALPLLLLLLLLSLLLKATSSSSSSLSTLESKSTSSRKPTSTSADPSSSITSSDSSSITSTQASVQTLISTVTASASSGGESIRSVTTTLHPSSTSTASSDANNNKKDSKGGSSLSTGGIVGVVIGSLAGAVLILGAIGFILYRRRHLDDEKDDEFTLSGPPEQKHPYNINNNPFLTANGDAVAGAGGSVGGASGGHNHNNLNSFSSSHGDDDFYLYDQPKMDLGDKRSSEFGRRRLSDGSLPDMTRNPSTLKVVNN